MSVPIVIRFVSGAILRRFRFLLMRLAGPQARSYKPARATSVSIESLSRHAAGSLREAAPRLPRLMRVASLDSSLRADGRAAEFAARLAAVVGLCFACGASAQNFWSEDVWKSEERGFLYYPDENKPENKPVTKRSATQPRFTDLASIQSAEELKAEHAFRLQTASFDPTEANVLAFQEVNHFVQEKAALFTDVYRRVSWQNPQYDFSTRHPSANFAQVDLQAQRKTLRTQNLGALAREWGLLYFYRGDCRFCALQSPLIKRLADEFGFEVLAVSLDGSPSDFFPEALPDNGISKLVTDGAGLDRVPALFMVKSDMSRSYHVSTGVLALEDILMRMETLALKTPGQTLFGGSDAISSAHDSERAQSKTTKTSANARNRLTTRLDDRLHQNDGIFGFDRPERQFTIEKASSEKWQPIGDSQPNTGTL